MNRIILIAMLITTSLSLLADEITKTYRFSNPKTEQIGEYQTIQFENCLLSSPAGQPLMPYQSVALLLPPGHDVASFELVFGKESELTGDFLIYPRQHAQPLSKGGSGIFIKDESVYQKDANYPERSYGEIEIQYLNGCSIALCSFTPLRYNPFTGKVVWYNSATVKIITEPNRDAGDALQNLNHSKANLEKLNTLVQNPEALKSYPATDNRSGAYDLLYITPAAYAEGLQLLVDFYFPRGLIGKVATTEDIYATMAGQDNPEKIRNYIILEYQNHGITHVTLGGDVEHVPYRGFYCGVQSSSWYEDDNIPSDLYYAALDGNWNDDGDSLWGEIGEDDLLPEIGVGRMSFSTQAELDAMIHKTMQYQQNPVAGEFDNPLLVGENLYDDPQTWGSDYLELLIGVRDDNGYETTGIPETQNIEKLYASETSWSKTDLMNLMNLGGSFIHHVGHANSGYNMKMYNSDITNTNFSGLNGTDHNYAIIFSHGCICGAFDNSDCIGETMVQIDNLAAAVFMNSRYGWFNEGQSEGPAAHINRELVDAFYDKEECRLGSAYTLARISTAPWVNAPGQWEDGALRWNFYDCNLLGDAALSFWTGEPEVVNAGYTDTIQTGASSFQVQIMGGSDLEGLTCHLVYGDTLSAGIAQTDASGFAEIVFDNPLADTATLTLYISGKNYKLTEFPVTVVPATATWFQPVWTTPFNPMAIFVTQATIDDLPMQAGDEIGVFDVDPNTGNEICVGVGVLTEEISDGNFLEITTSMDDGSGSGSATGFTAGNEMLYKCYKSATGQVTEGSPEYPYPGYDEVFTALGNAIVNLSGSLTVQHVLTMRAGWSGISSWVVPYNTSIPQLISEISGQVVIISDGDAFYQPATGGGTLDNWNYNQGYLIKVTDQVSITFEGTVPVQKSIQLNEGWNLIPVLSETNVLVEDLFGGNLENIVVVKDAVGIGAYWPDQNITTLQVLQSGKAYLVKASSGFVLTF